MKLKFRIQKFQTEAVKSVTDCFNGQPNESMANYRIDPGRVKQQRVFEKGFKNTKIEISPDQVLENIKKVQTNQNLPVSASLIKSKVCPINLDIEMETGTGKTYCYIKTMFEMNKLYGWSKFIVVVPSIAIREGVKKSFEITAEHFLELYGKKADFFIYNSGRLHEIESFSSSARIKVMIINVQAFTRAPKPGASKRTIMNQKNIIYRELDDFQSRRPIDVIKKNNPILIVDEPQKIEGDHKKASKSFEALAEFNPLMILRYSATHKKEHNKIYRLDALDAYNQKLVKKIAVRGISFKGLGGTGAYLYLEGIEISKFNPVARIEIEQKLKSGSIKKYIKKLKVGDSLYAESNELDQYKGFTISEINALNDTVSFTNGVNFFAGQVMGDVNDELKRRLQIREAIRAHIEREEQLFSKGIKVLSLFFIDEVAKYRQYSEENKQLSGLYANMFEEEYNNILSSSSGHLFEPEYEKYLRKIDVSSTHKGYFSIDKKSKQLVDPAMSKTEKAMDMANDIDAYDLILKDKERLLSFDEPTRFIFSHSALREGWDNPNVFVICTLKHSSNTISRRQEVGRGLRIAVNKYGERTDDPAFYPSVNIHKNNVLTVVTDESYQDFVTGLQRDISLSLSQRPKKAEKEYFLNKVVTFEDTIDSQTSIKKLKITEDMADGIEFYLIQNGYVDRKKQITDKYHEDVKNNNLSPLPDDLEKYKNGIFTLVDSVFSEKALPVFENARAAKTNPLNSNFAKKEFKQLWNSINKKVVYTVDFDSQELINKSIALLNSNLKVSPLIYTVKRGQQIDDIDFDDIKEGQSFTTVETETQKNDTTIYSSVKYDLIGKICEGVKLTRKTVARILKGINRPVFDQFKKNPEDFISRVIEKINEQKATVIIERLSYNTLEETHDIDIFTQNQISQNFLNATRPLDKHIYDYLVTDSKIEKAFALELESSSEVVVYAKLPGGFYIPTPVGNYNPDWAIAFKKDSVKHIFFIAETKGSMKKMDLREVEYCKIKCAKKYFKELSEKHLIENVQYDVVNNYEELMKIVS